MSADRVKCEHIHRVFELCNKNVSETARRLKMHRRTLQEFFLKDLQDNLNNFLNFLICFIARVAIKIFNNSANKKGCAPNLNIGLSQPIKVPSHNIPNT